MVMEGCSGIGAGGAAMEKVKRVGGPISVGGFSADLSVMPKPVEVVVAALSKEERNTAKAAMREADMWEQDPRSLEEKEEELQQVMGQQPPCLLPMCHLPLGPIPSLTHPDSPMPPRCPPTSGSLSPPLFSWRPWAGPG